MRLFALLLALGSAGCANPPLTITHEEMGRLGPKPTAEEIETLSRSALEGSLKDPESLRLRNLTDAVPGYVKTGPIVGSKFIGEGWLWAGEVNAKNSFGGYVGFSTWVFFRFTDGDVFARESGTIGASFCVPYTVVEARDVEEPEAVESSPRVPSSASEPSGN